MLFVIRDALFLESPSVHSPEGISQLPPLIHCSTGKIVSILVRNTLYSEGIGLPFLSSTGFFIFLHIIELNCFFIDQWNFGHGLLFKFGNCSFNIFHVSVPTLSLPACLSSEVPCGSIGTESFLGTNFKTSGRESTPE